MKSAEARGAVVHALKERLDEAVRRHPPSALEVAEVLARAAREAPGLEALARRGRAVALHFNGRDEEAIEQLPEKKRMLTASGLREHPRVNPWYSAKADKKPWPSP